MNATRVKACGTIAYVAVLLACTLCSEANAQPTFPCRRWTTLDPAAKLGIVVAFVQVAAKDKVVIKLKPEYYVTELDSLVAHYQATRNEQALDSSLGSTIHTIAAMEGDWGNGEPPLEHAKKWMGPWFTVFQRLYPEKHKRLVQEAGRRGPDGFV